MYEFEAVDAPVRTKRRKLSNQDWKDIQALHAQGMTQNQLAQQYGVTYKAIRRVLGRTND